MIITMNGLKTENVGKIFDNIAFQLHPAVQRTSNQTDPSGRYSPLSSCIIIIIIVIVIVSIIIIIICTITNLIPNHISILTLLLRYGAFGVVWSVTDPRDGKRVALKKLPNVFQSLVSSKRVFRELKMMRFFKHENVLSCLDILQVRAEPDADLAMMKITDPRKPLSQPHKPNSPVCHLVDLQRHRLECS